MSDIEFKNVTAKAVANVYFDGKVVSHTVLFADGSRKTLGLVFPGTFEFNVGAKERMEITAGTCRVKVKGEASHTTYEAGSYFDVPENSSFEIVVESGIAQYICSFG